MNKEPRKIKIIAGKQPFTAQVIDLKTGEDLADMITGITIRILAKNNFVPMAEVEFFDVEIDIDAVIETKKLSE